MQLRERLEQCREHFRVLPDRVRRELDDIILELKMDEVKEKAKEPVKEINTDVGKRAKTSKKASKRSK